MGLACVAPAWLVCGFGAGLACHGADGVPASAPAVEVRHSPGQPHSGEAVKITARLGRGAAGATLFLQVVEPGRYIELRDPAFKSTWVARAMNDAGVDGDERAGDGVFTATVGGDFQRHRRLVRYRVSCSDPGGRTNSWPARTNPVPNFAYFVYDGIPGWRGAIEPKSREAARRTAVEFSAEVMGRVQAYHLLGKKESIEKVTWREPTGGNEYKYTGTVVADGVAYDHVRYRARGGVWRYAMGKNMWKFDFNRSEPLQARDDYGQPYAAPWHKVNLRACIQQGDYGMRGEQGMFESAGFRLFNLAGVPAPRTHWIQLRIIDEAEEQPADQYRGDFWGLYLAIEDVDGQFLREHGLPDGNVFKMEGWSGQLSHHAVGAVTNRSDLDRFLEGYSNTRQPESWWAANVNLPAYYSYRAILECIHHYDVGEGKNYYYYWNPKAAHWQVIPWDIDLTWADHMYGSGDEPFHSRVLARPTFRAAYRNRLGEIRDLLFNRDQAGQLIDECAAVIANPRGGRAMVDADRARWDFNPVMAMGGKAGQGLFYEAAPTHDFAGMVRLMKDYVGRRGAWIDATLLRDPRMPRKPTLAYSGPAGFARSSLAFRASDYQGTNEFAALQWRLAEVAGADWVEKNPRQPRPYEITAQWTSPELSSFRNDVTIPAEPVKAGQTYRVRVRMKDATGRWSHWSDPVQFKAGS